MAADDDVAQASPPQVNDDGTAVIWQVAPTSGPQEKETTQLVERLRDDVLPPVEDEIGTQVAVTGNVAVGIDFTDYLASRMPYFFTAVLGLSFLLLMVVFRSLLVPLKAVIMNMLSIAAAYGIVVALFQWGWLSDITGVEPAPIEPWIPMMLFAIVFGLSMDYEVFLLSRIREEWIRTGDSRTAVADGLASTAKVITAAAAIMVFVFGSFLLESDRVLKLMGVGLAAAILLDATIVRMLLVPATMELLGDKNWWLPRWLDRILPNLDVEGHAEPLPEDEGEERPRQATASPSRPASRATPARRADPLPHPGPRRHRSPGPGRARRRRRATAGSRPGSCPAARPRRPGRGADGSVTMRRWSGCGQLKPVPCTTRIFSCTSRSSTRRASSWMSWTSGSRRGKTYSAPLGATQLTPGMLLRPATATSRCSSSRPPGSTRSSMLWCPVSAAWMACCAGTLGHRRDEASRWMPSRKPSAWPLGPVMASQPERNPATRYVFDRPLNVRHSTSGARVASEMCSASS